MKPKLVAICCASVALLALGTSCDHRKTADKKEAALRDALTRAHNSAQRKGFRADELVSILRDCSKSPYLYEIRDYDRFLTVRLDGMVLYHFPLIYNMSMDELPKEDYELLCRIGSNSVANITMIEWGTNRAAEPGRD